MARTGRPKKENPLDEYIELRLSSTEKQGFKDAAELSGMALATWVRDRLRKMAIREVMSDPLPQVPCEAPVERLTYLLSHEEPAVFVQMGNGRFEIITKYDLMGTIAGLMEQKR